MNRRAFLAAVGGALLPVIPAFALGTNYQRALANVLVSEGGNDDDPRDSGGRTSRGIIQREWNVWRRTHGAPGRGELPADVWKAPQDQIEAIYREKYWDAMRGDDLPIGLDYSVFDLAVHSGAGRSGKSLRRAIGLPTDSWRVTDAVMAAIKKHDAATLITKINDERRRFLNNLAVGKNRAFRGGWLSRVASVKAISLRMADPASSLFDIPDEPAFGPGKAY